MLKFRRIEAGRYQADTPERRYVVAKYGKGWLVTCWTMIDTAGIDVRVTDAGRELIMNEEN